jgi:apolipoprotein N-acyltransferase
MHPLVTELAVDLIYLAAVAVPVGIIVAASETPKPDQRALLVMVVGAAAASIVTLSFAGVAVVGLAWIAIGIRDIGTIVLVAALFGLGLGAVYSRRISRRTTSES